MKRPPGDARDLPFDLPLDPLGTMVEPSRRAEGAQPELPLDSPSTRPAPAPETPETQEPPEAPVESEPGPRPASSVYARRWAAGALDGGVHLAVLVLAAAGSWWLGVPLTRVSILPLVVFLGCFSFVYHIVPLTFWGHTPGMAGVGLVARDPNGEPLTIHQAGQRWLGGILNLATLGLFFLISRERSLPDLLSRSKVSSYPPAP